MLNILFTEKNKIMRYLLILFISSLLIGCSAQEEDGPVIETNFDNDTITEEKQEPVQEIIEIVPGGAHQEYHPNGQLKIDGQYDKNSQRTGLWISYYENGEKWSESYYVEGVQDGHSLTFFPNGQVRFVGEYKAGERIGEWRFYDESGELVKTENFD